MELFSLFVTRCYCVAVSRIRVLRCNPRTERIHASSGYKMKGIMQYLLLLFFDKIFPGLCFGIVMMNVFLIQN